MSAAKIRARAAKRMAGYHRRYFSAGRRASNTPRMPGHKAFLDAAEGAGQSSTHKYKLSISFFSNTRAALSGPDGTKCILAA